MFVDNFPDGGYASRIPKHGGEKLRRLIISLVVVLLLTVATVVPVFAADHPVPGCVTGVVGADLIQLPDCGQPDDVPPVDVPPVDVPSGPPTR